MKLDNINRGKTIKFANHGKLLSKVAGIPNKKSDWNILKEHTQVSFRTNMLMQL